LKKGTDQLLLTSTEKGKGSIMVNYGRDPNKQLYASVMNIGTGKRFKVLNAYNPYVSVWQQAVIIEKGVGRIFDVLKCFVAPNALKPVLICEALTQEAAEEIVKILSELFESKSVADIVTQYCSSATNQFGDDMIFFEIDKWRVRE
jgi:hypothetical protein